MQKLMLAMVTLGLLVVSQGCAPSTQQVEPDFPKDQAPAVMSTMQLDKVIGEVGSLKGNLIKLAGRIRHVRETDQGAIVLADWLSYPSHFSIEEGPPHTGPKTGRHFGFLFPGKKSDPFLKGPSFDSLMTWKGNKFVLEGKVEGTRTMAVDEFGDKQSLLFVETVCIHVWETGESDTITSTTGDDRYWLGTTARTFCAPKQEFLEVKSQPYVSFDIQGIDPVLIYITKTPVPGLGEYVQNDGYTTRYQMNLNIKF